MGKEGADMIYFDHEKASGTISHDSFMQELGIKNKPIAKLHN